MAAFPGEGSTMSTYGKTIYNPYEQSSQWIEQIEVLGNGEKSECVFCLQIIFYW